MPSKKHSLLRNHRLSALLLGFLASISTAQSAAAQGFWREVRSDQEFAYVPAGCFFMGADAVGESTPSRPPQPPLRDELPRHQVCLDAFWLARTEVTGAAWQRVMSTNRKTPPTHPVTNVSIEEAETYLARLNANANGEYYRLPTEAEWEYACRSGEPVTNGQLLGYQSEEGLRAVAHFHEVSSKKRGTQPAAGRAPNGYGLYDMLGNVWEWAADAYAADAYARHAHLNPRLVAPTGRRSMRGGSYQTGIHQIRCSGRAWGVPGDSLPTVGLRVLREDRAPTSRESQRNTK